MGEIVRRLLERKTILPRPLREYAMRAQVEGPEATVQRWRERGVPESAIELAMKMADRWLKGVLK